MAHCPLDTPDGGKSRNVTVTRIDFDSIYKARSERYAVVLDDVFTPNECKDLIAAAEASTTHGWERAMVNIGGGHQKMIEDVRNCGRIIWDSPEVVDEVWKRIEHLPEVQQIVRLQNVPKIFGLGPQRRGEVWKFTRPNERMRFLKYVGGEYFRPHCDGTYETPDRKERSYFTMHLYLNDGGPDSELGGGATTFHAYNMVGRIDVVPKAGRVLLFQHRDLLHSGDDVVKGTKYTMRTDLMYTLESSESESRRKVPTLEDEKPRT